MSAHPKMSQLLLYGDKTRNEVFEKRLVGTRHEDWNRDCSGLQSGDLIAVYDYSIRKHELIGPMRVTRIGKPMTRNAWGGASRLERDRRGGAAPSTPLPIDPVIRLRTLHEIREMNRRTKRSITSQSICLRTESTVTDPVVANRMMWRPRPVPELATTQPHGGKGSSVIDNSRKSRC